MFLDLDRQRRNKEPLDPFHSASKNATDEKTELSDFENVYLSFRLAEECKSVFNKFISMIPNRMTLKKYCDEDLHCTIVHSKKIGFKQGDFRYMNHHQTCGCVAYVKTLEIFGKDDSSRFLVATLDSPDLEAYNAYISNKFGLVSDFHSYRPHITLVKLPPVDGKGDVESSTLNYFLSLADKAGLRLGGLKITLEQSPATPIDDNWSAKVKSAK